MIRLEIRAGGPTGGAFEIVHDVVLIGSAPTNHVVLNGVEVEPEHARLLVVPTGVLLESLAVEHSTARIREGIRTPTHDGNNFKVTLREGDLIELGSGESATVLKLTSVPAAAPEPHVVALRRIDDVLQAKSRPLDSQRLNLVLSAQRKIAGETSLDAVLAAVTVSALELTPGATHATLVLRSDDESNDYLPVLTRVRDPAGTIVEPKQAVPVSRSVFRKVVAERATVLAADAAGEVGASESLLGASIRSTLGVPLFKGDELLGVLQVDNRSAPAMLSHDDVETLSLLGTSASLALANARLINRLQTAEAKLRKENTYLRSREVTRSGGRKLLAKSAPMLALLEDIKRIAPLRVSVLIEGETGVGKELIASSLHYQSNRADKLFVTQNCASFPDSLLESELFGHKRGAFTGAIEDKKGLFEIADGGTLFLDEVGEMPFGLQAKLLRVLQEGEFRQLGSNVVRHVDVRVVAATNRSLEKEVAAGRFRQDLYYRLNVYPLRVPPLRERRDDIAPLAIAFMNDFAKEIGKSITGFAQRTVDLLTAHDWPGNVRELQNEVQRLVIQAPFNALIPPELLSPSVRKLESTLAKAGATKGTLRDALDAMERYLILEALMEHPSKTEAAKTLGITREALHKKIRVMGLQVPEKQQKASSHESDDDSDSDE